MKAAPRPSSCGSSGRRSGGWIRGRSRNRRRKRSEGGGIYVPTSGHIEVRGMRGAPASPAASAAIAEVESAAWARAAGAPLASLPCRPTAEKRGDGSCDTVGGMICTVTCTCFLIHLIGSFTVGGMVCTVCFFDSFDHSRRSAAVCFSPCFTCAHGISRIHGTSIVLYRNHKIRKHQFVAVAEWTGGLYVSPTMARSRPSGLIAGAWAAMMSLGLNGYMENTGHIMEASKKIQRG